MNNLIPGEIITEQGEIELNLGKEVKTVKVSNSGDRPPELETVTVLTSLPRFNSISPCSEIISPGIKLLIIS